MKVMSRLLIAAIAMATPMLLAAQAPPAPGPGEQDAGPGRHMRRGMGPGFGTGEDRGMMQHRGFGGGFMHHQRGMEMNHFIQDPAIRERLKITPEQFIKFQAQESAMAKSMIRSHADIQVKRMELAELMRSENPDRALIDRKLREVQESTFAAEKARIDNQLAMRQLFTPEQRQEMEKLRSEFRGHMNQRNPGSFGEGGMRPRGPRRMGPPPQQQPQPPVGDNL